MYDEKAIEKHGMTSEKASRIKLRGHNKEYLFLDVINGGKVVKGTNKIDIVDKKGRSYTIKGGSEVKGKAGTEGRWQLFLYKKSRFVKDKEFPLRKIMIEILEIFPKTIEDYREDEDNVKRGVGKKMIELKKIMTDEDNLRNFFNKSIFNFNIDYLVIYHNDIFHLFSKGEVLEIFDNELKVKTNASFQKIVFEYDNKIAIELEVRKSKGKYPSILLITSKSKIFNILLSNLKKKKEIKRNLIVYGKESSNFKL